MTITTPAAADLIEWWREASHLQRYVADLIKGELSVLRPGYAFPAGQEWTGATHLVHDIGVDSLELLSIASALSEAVHMHESGIEDYLLARPTLGEWVQITGYALGKYAQTLTFRTSGSAGTPKPCSHALLTLSQEVHALRRLLSSRTRILSAVPAHHIYGFLFTVLLPQADGEARWPVLDLRGCSPSRLAQEARDGDLVIGFPEWWKGVTRSAVRIKGDVVGVTSTAPCPAEVSKQVLQTGISRLYEIYGSSETAGIGWRDDCESPYVLFPHWRRASDSNALLRIMPDGAQASAECRIECRDNMNWISERTFMPAGRVDEAVQVGGINVFPSRVRALLLQHPQVADASVRLMAPEEGTRLKAFIVPRQPDTDASALHQSLTTWVQEHLSTPERPRAFAFGTELPRSATGKLCDWPVLPSQQFSMSQ